MDLCDRSVRRGLVTWKLRIHRGDTANTETTRRKTVLGNISANLCGLRVSAVKASLPLLFGFAFEAGAVGNTNVMAIHADQAFGPEPGQVAGHDFANGAET